MHSKDKRIKSLSSLGGVAFIGYVLIAIFFLGFGYWAFTAPLSGAAIASGRIAAAGENQKVQHLEGGIIKQIHVQQGDKVTLDTPIFTLDNTQSKSSLSRLERQAVSLDARLARLSAERDQVPTLTFSSDLIARAIDLDIKTLLDEQTKEFITRKNRLNSEIKILNQRIEALKDSITGLIAREKALNEQINVVSQEVERKQKLLDRQLTNRSEYTQLLRSQADLVGRLGAITSDIAAARNQMLEAQEEIERQRTSTAETTIQEINQLRVEQADIVERIISTKDILTRTIIRSPTDGFIIDMNKNAVGGVVRPAEDLVTILPTSRELVVSARLSLSDIDNVRPQQKALLRFSALNLRLTPEVPGEVIFISPDRLIDEATREPYYEARLRILELPPQVTEDQIYPGMPVDALISTGERTFIDYIMRPLFDSMSLAFREQ